MVGTVIEHDFEVNHRISGEVSAASCVLNTLLNRRNEVLWNGAAEDLIRKLELTTAGERLHLDLAVPVLAVSAGLLLMTALHIGAPANGLAIRHFRRLQVYFGVIALLE